MSGLRERLGRLTRTGGGNASLHSAGNWASAVSPEQAAWVRMGFTETEPSGVLVREAVYPPDARHGLYRMKELGETAAALAKLGPDRSHVSPERLLFLDTETTGLGQGAGNVAFLVGVGCWEQGAFKVRQYVIRHPGEESGMLSELAAAAERSSHLVTYNGRAFDWPLMKNRYVLNRLSSPKDPAHLDLLYPARSLWQSTMPSCRLGAVEEAKLGVVREEDVPGSLAPALYFQYLAERNPSVLKGVVRHNERDVLTLLSLAVHFGRLLEQRVPMGQMKADELLRLGLWYERLGMISEAGEALDALCARPADKIAFVLHETAMFYKRRKQWEQAIAAWKTLAEDRRRIRANAIEPCIELAMIYEHRYKDAREALRWTEEALRIAETRLSLARAGTDTRMREVICGIQKRRERLLRKQHTLF